MNIIKFRRFVIYTKVLLRLMRAKENKIALGCIFDDAVQEKTLAALAHVKKQPIVTSVRTADPSPILSKYVTAAVYGYTKKTSLSEYALNIIKSSKQQ